MNYKIKTEKSMSSVMISHVIQKADKPLSESWQGGIFGGRYLVSFWWLQVLSIKFVSEINTMQSIYIKYLLMEGALWSIKQLS